MLPPQVLKSVEAKLKTVEFDPTDREHMIAYLCMTEHGRQHPTLRFALEHPFLDVRSMMGAKIARMHATRFPHIDEAVAAVLAGKKQPEPQPVWMALMKKT